MTAARHAGDEELLRAAERLGARVSAAELIARYVEHADERVRGAALMMMAGQARQQLVSANQAVGMMLRAVRRSAIERRVAVEQLGFVTPTEDREPVARTLCELLERPDLDAECAEYAVLSLVNLYSTQATPEHVLVAVAQTTTREDRAGALARWFLERNWPKHS